MIFFTYLVIQHLQVNGKKIFELQGSALAIGQNYCSLVSAHVGEKCVVIYTRKPFTTMLNFMTPATVVYVLARGYFCHLVKLHCFLKNRLLVSSTKIELSLRL